MNRNISFTILANGYGAFCEQGMNLAAGFKKLGCKVNIVVVNKKEKKETYKECRGDFIISIGSWRDWDELYRIPKKLGKKVFPWLVSDDKVFKYIREINKSPTLFVTSKFCQETFEKAGVKKEIIEMIPEGIDTDFWKSIAKEEIEKIKSILSLPKDDKEIILLTIGGDGASKGAQETLSALGGLSSLNILYLIKTMTGGDSFFQGLKEMKIIKKFDLKYKVKYIMGKFSNKFIRDLINLCDIYVAPSRHEGFGLPHVQAMACRKPVITCRGTAAEETSLNGITGYIVSSRPTKWENAAGYIVDGVKADVNKLKEALKKLILDKKLRETMGKNAREHVVKNYESKKVAQIFLEKIKRFM